MCVWTCVLYTYITIQPPNPNPLQQQTHKTNQPKHQQQLPLSAGGHAGAALPPRPQPRRTGGMFHMMRYNAYIYVHIYIYMCVGGGVFLCLLCKIYVCVRVCVCVCACVCVQPRRMGDQPPCVYIYILYIIYIYIAVCIL
jgi:hypothetical protein